MSTSRTLALAALCALAPAAAPTPAVAQGRYQAQGAARRHFQEGDALQARGDRARAEGDQKGAREAFKDAVSRFRKAIEADPGYVDAYARIGRLYYDLDQPDEAIPLLRAGLKRQADSVDLQFWLGQHLLRARDGKAPKPEQLEEGLALLRQVVGATDRFPEAHLVLANHLYDTGDFAGASGHYERYLAANPDAHNIRARLGNAYVKQQRHADALGAFRRVHEAKPDDVAVTINLGTAHFNLGQYEDAVKLLEAALKRDPNRQSALFNLAQSYFQLGRFAEAVPIYQRFTAAKPKSFNGWYFAGSALMELGRDDEALAALAKARALKPKIAQPAYKVGLIHLRNGRLDQAETALNEARAAAPDDAWVLSGLGTIARARGDAQKAYTLHADAAQHGADIARLQANLAVSALAAGKRPEAEKAVDAALALDSKDDWVRDAAVAVLSAAARDEARAGHLPEAAARLDRALGLRPEHPVLLADRALVRAAAGEVAGARADADAAAAQAPDTALTAMAQGRARLAAGDVGGAATAFAQAAKAAPSAAAAAAEGAARLLGGQVDEAITVLDAANAAHANDAAVQRNRALAHLRRAAGRLRGGAAEADIKAALAGEAALDPLSAARLRYAALVLALRDKDGRAAEAHLNQLAAHARAARDAGDNGRYLSPRASARHLDLITVQVNILLGRLDRALSLLDGMREASRPGNEASELKRAVHERLAAALFERGDLRNAERHLQAAQKLGATPETEHNLAVLAWQQGKRKRQLQQWTALVSKVPEARFNLGVALEAAGRHREAYEAFDRFAKTGGGPNAAKAGEIAEAKRRIFGFAEAP